MGFYVPTNRDVKFPKACEQCHFYDGLLCCVMDTYVHDPENKHEECPLIEIPDNHGRLIDADAMIRDIERAIVPSRYIKERNADMVKFLSLEDTVIPADEMI